MGEISGGVEIPSDTTFKTIYEIRIDAELARLSKNYLKRKVLHQGFNSGDLRRIQAITFIKTGKRKSLKVLDWELKKPA